MDARDKRGHDESIIPQAGITVLFAAVREAVIEFWLVSCTLWACVAGIFGHSTH
jgi:hypothetical protein